MYETIYLYVYVDPHTYAQLSEYICINVWRSLLGLSVDTIGLFAVYSKGTFVQESQKGYHLIQVKITVTQSVISTVTLLVKCNRTPPRRASLQFAFTSSSHIFFSWIFFNWLGKSQDCTRIFQYYCSVVTGVGGKVSFVLCPPSMSIIQYYSNTLFILSSKSLLTFNERLSNCICILWFQNDTCVNLLRTTVLVFKDVVFMTFFNLDTRRSFCCSFYHHCGL